MELVGSGNSVNLCAEHQAEIKKISGLPPVFSTDSECSYRLIFVTREDFLLSDFRERPYSLCGTVKKRIPALLLTKRTSPDIYIFNSKSTSYTTNNLT